MNAEQAQWIRTIEQEAVTGTHVFPLMAACEAALESGYGQSELAHDGNNLFGMKQHRHPEYGTLALPTKEFLDGQWEVVEADWVKYPQLSACFLDRMHTLGRLSNYYPHYKAALAAADAEDAYEYVKQVSQSWSSDPERAAKVIEIYDAYCEHWAANPSSTPAPEQPEAPVMGVEESTT